MNKVSLNNPPQAKNSKGKLSSNKPNSPRSTARTLGLSINPSPKLVDMTARPQRPGGIGAANTSPTKSPKGGSSSTNNSTTSPRVTKPGFGGTGNMSPRFGGNLPPRTGNMSPRSAQYNTPRTGNMSPRVGGNLSPRRTAQDNTPPKSPRSDTGISAWERLPPLTIKELHPIPISPPNTPPVPTSNDIRYLTSGNKNKNKNKNRGSIAGLPPIAPPSSIPPAPGRSRSNSKT